MRAIGMFLAVVATLCLTASAWAISVDDTGSSATQTGSWGFPAAEETWGGRCVAVNYWLHRLDGDVGSTIKPFTNLRFPQGPYDKSYLNQWLSPDAMHLVIWTDQDVSGQGFDYYNPALDNRDLRFTAWFDSNSDPKKAAVALHWKTVDASGTILHSGCYKHPLGGGATAWCACTYDQASYDAEVPYTAAPEVPEPATWMLLLATGALGAIRRRRRK